ncbi:MAG TPA: hypothetical protein VIG90_15660 [Pedomonas sp.]|uniref:hypothetical protein n=1 Tax=Pedomonas sp. TaxID=2976421 RepID=UPI002F401142
MNRAKLGIGGLVGIMAGLLMLAAANIQPFASPSQEDRAESVLVMLGYEPGSAQVSLPVVAQPVLVDCPDVTKSRPSTV